MARKNFPKSVFQNYIVSVEYMASAQFSWLGHIYQRCTIGEDVRFNLCVPGHPIYTIKGYESSSESKLNEHCFALTV